MAKINLCNDARMKESIAEQLIHHTRNRKEQNAKHRKYYHEQKTQINAKKENIILKVKIYSMLNEENGM